MRDYRTIDDITEEYLRDHPDEIDDYITELFEEYAQDEDIATLLSSLRVISRVKGVSFIAETSGLSRKGVQKALLSGNQTKGFLIGKFRSKYDVWGYTPIRLE